MNLFLDANFAKKEIEFKDCLPSTFPLFLEYVYSEKLYNHLTSTQVDKIFDLYNVASSFKLDYLQWYIQQSISGLSISIF